MYEMLKHKERSHHLEESEEICLHQEYNFRKAENVGVSKGAREREGARGASVTEPSGSTGSRSRDRPQACSAHRPERGALGRAG